MNRLDIQKILNKAKKISKELSRLIEYLLSNVSSVELVDDGVISTAAIIMEEEPRILIGKNFWKKKVNSYEDAVTVFAHEVLHQMIYTEERNELDNRFNNFVQDMWINGFLFAKYGIGKKLFRRLYGHSSPFFLLTPAGIIKEKESKAIRELFPESDLKRKKIKQIWLGVSENRFTPPQLKRHLLELFPPQFIPPYFLPVRTFINHTKFQKNTWIPLEVGRGSRGFSENGGESLEEEISEVDYVYHINQLVKIIYNYFSPSGQIKHRMLEEENVKGVIPRIGRREIITISQGKTPVFFDSHEIFKTTSYKSAGIYIDVSGSMDEFYPPLYSLMKKLSSFIEPPYYIFSTKIYETTLSDLKKKIIRTTLGTSIDIVIEDARKKRLKNVVIVTDTLWHLSDENLKWAKNNLNLILIIMDNTGPEEYFELPDRSEVIRLKKAGASVIRWFIA